MRAVPPCLRSLLESSSSPYTTLTPPSVTWSQSSKVPSNIYLSPCTEIQPFASFSLSKYILRLAENNLWWMFVVWRLKNIYLYSIHFTLIWPGDNYSFHPQNKKKWENLYLKYIKCIKYCLLFSHNFTNFNLEVQCENLLMHRNLCDLIIFNWPTALKYISGL